MSNILWSVLGNHAIVSFSEHISTPFDVSEGVKGAEIIKSFTSNCIRGLMDMSIDKGLFFRIIFPALSVVKKKPAVIDILYNLSLDIEN